MPKKKVAHKFITRILPINNNWQMPVVEDEDDFEDITAPSEEDSE